MIAAPMCLQEVDKRSEQSRGCSPQKLDRSSTPRLRRPALPANSVHAERRNGEEQKHSARWNLRYHTFPSLSFPGDTRRRGRTKRCSRSRAGRVAPPSRHPLPSPADPTCLPPPATHPPNPTAHSTTYKSPPPPFLPIRFHLPPHTPIQSPPTATPHHTIDRAIQQPKQTNPTMGRSPCCEKAHTNKGAWTKEEDDRLVAYIRAHGEGCWRSLPRAAGLLRCGKSCRLRWINYLRPDLKRGNFTPDEDALIVTLHGLLGNRWSLIAARLPGRTDNEIKNYWNTHIRRRLLASGIDPVTHRPVKIADDSPAPVTQQQQQPRCTDLNLDLCISPPSSSSSHQQQEEEERKPPVVVVKREVTMHGLSRGGGLCFGCSLGLQKGGTGCSCSDRHFLGLRPGMLGFRGLETK
ncbi:hypothetical protein HU200_011733 [Digitaria exilis]|uniref:Uncharacterized protein n=1 Tax=Digitaria exilis TaxID=1010633 RepID=A0A835KMD2_9POAL|nr:hypothetical protein HU200_011733 [Digitaria exilis]